jgi:PleD family two-component response regulator
LSISCGVATAYPERKDEGVNALIQKADKALYEAKRLGKNRVISYGDFHRERVVYAFQSGVKI